MILPKNISIKKKSPFRKLLIKSLYEIAKAIFWKNIIIMFKFLMQKIKLVSVLQNNITVLKKSKRYDL